MKRVILASALIALSSGCIGTNALTTKTRRFNLDLVENRYGREGIFLGMQVLWVYRISTLLDLLVFNSIEYWSGTNPINGRSALADVPPSQVEKLGLAEIDRARTERLSANAAKLYLDFKNGDRMTFDALRDGDEYAVSYLGRVFYKGRIESAGRVAQ